MDRSSQAFHSDYARRDINVTLLTSLILQCSSVVSRFEFSRALRAAHALFPYDRFACSITDTTNYRSRYFFNLNFSDECLHDLQINRCDAQCVLIEEWRRYQEPLWVTRGLRTRRHPG